MFNTKDAGTSTAGARLFHSGEKAPGIHLVDLNLYDTSLFGNALVFEASDALLIFDTGTSRNIGQIVSYLDFHEIHPKRAWIVPSHQHFDHVGGITGLLRHFQRNHVHAEVLVNEQVAEMLVDLPAVTEPARKQFRKMMGVIEPVPRDFIRVLSNEERFLVDEHHELVLVPTPGHCHSHVSPLVLADGRPYFQYFGEAMGINLRKHLSPLPASTAPCFDSREYRASLAKLKEQGPELGFFAHVGGVKGRKNIEDLCTKAGSMLDEVTRFVQLEYECGNGDTRILVSRMLDRYQEYIATCVMDEEIVRNLAFLLVYGILKDLGLK